MDQGVAPSALVRLGILLESRPHGRAYSKPALRASLIGIRSGNLPTTKYPNFSARLDSPMTYQDLSVIATNPKLELRFKKALTNGGASR